MTCIDDTILKRLNEIDQLKQRLEALTPYDPVILDYFKKALDVDLTYNSNAIEGSTLTLQETKFILNDGLVSKPKPVREVLEAINHRDAIRYVETLKPHVPHIISEEEILNIHREILKGIHPSYAGTYRTDAVYIKLRTGKIQHFCEWTEVSSKVKALLQWVRDHASEFHPVLLAAELHYRFVSIHPFIDGNGRTARLLMNLILIQHGYPMADIKVESREPYLDAIQLARETENMIPFYEVGIDALKESLMLHIETFEKRILWK